MLDAAQGEHNALPANGVEGAEQQIDRLLLDGLRLPKDRILLLRSDMELEKFITDPS